MAAIKRFFEKKKLEMKFKKAGEGHKLTDDTRRAGGSPAAAGGGGGGGASSSGYRSAPSSDSRMAGQAALARLSQPKGG